MMERSAAATQPFCLCGVALQLLLCWVLFLCGSMYCCYLTYLDGDDVMPVHVPAPQEIREPCVRVHGTYSTNRNFTGEFSLVYCAVAIAWFGVWGLGLSILWCCC